MLVVRPRERVEVQLRERGVRFHLLAPTADNQIEPAVFTLAPGAQMRHAIAHHGEEALYVLRGRVRLHVGASTHELSADDAAYYKSTLPHRFANLSQEDDVQLLVTTSHPALDHTKAQHET